MNNLIANVKRDVEVQFPPESRMRCRPLRAFLWCVFTMPGFRCILLYRLAYSARSTIPWVGIILSKFLGWFIRHWYGCTLASTARLGGGIVFPHPQGIVIGGWVEMAGDSWVFQNVTLGGKPGEEGHPTIGREARIYTGAVLAGNIIVGEHVTVGANAVVSFNVPDHSIIRAPKSFDVSGQLPKTNA